MELILAFLIFMWHMLKPLLILILISAVIVFVFKLIVYYFKKSRYSTATDPLKKLEISIQPKSLKISITEPKEMFFLINISGKIRKNKKVKMRLITANSEIQNAGVLKIVMNGDENHAKVFKIADLPYDFGDQKTKSDDWYDYDNPDNYARWIEDVVDYGESMEYDFWK